MVIFLNLDGSCENVTPQKVYQGSNNVTEITVVAPFPSTTKMQIGFVLPDGLYWETSEHARYVPMEFVPQETVSGINVWKFILPFSVTAQQGDLYIAVNATTADGNTTSYMVKQIIEESVLPNEPNPPDLSVYDYLSLYLARLDGRTENVANLVKSVQKVAPNAITYTTNSGVESSPIVIEGGDTAPIPVNAASTVKIPLDAWQPVYSGQAVTGYTALITAAMHGQMRDGATANDLWVSFDETDGGVISGAYQGYTVSETGDITINVNQPVAMTVRVWNGKGLVDNMAREMIEKETERAEQAETTLQDNIDAETERAEAEEAHLQEQIDELHNTGVDLTARRMVQEETERAHAAESNLQTLIDDETKRATDVENGLASDIQGLREDIDNEEHFRGMFTSVEALRAAYPTATPNDYAYIVGGNQWVWENGAWFDSGESTPNTAVPKGTSTPLMDGVGSAGVANEYAAIDHRHPSDTNKVNKSGDTMTGSLTVPKILGAGENEGKGIIPVRYITREELGTATSDVDGYIQAWIKKVCELYPNTEHCIFIGSGNPAAAITLQACIYNTSERNSDGVPRYAYGVCLEYGYTNNIQQFGIIEYAYEPKKPFMTREGRWLDGDVKNATHSGVYYCSADSTGLPSGANRFGQLFVSHEHDTIAQIYISHENKQMWARGGKYSGGEVWTDWYRLANYDEVYSPNNPPPTAKDNKYGTVYGFTSNDIKETTRNTIGATTLGYNSVVQHGTGGTLQNCTAIGRAAEVRAFDGTATHGNCTAIGYGAGIYTADNTIQMGNSSISSCKCKVGVSTTSDERDKTDITVIDDGKALQFITQIDPIQYVDNDRNKYLLREKKIDEETGEEVYDENGEHNQEYMRYGMCEYDREAHARGDKKGERKRIGVKAQQIQQLLSDIFGSDNYANIVNDDHYDLRADGNEPPVENHLTVTYERIIPFLIGAIREQQKQIDELRASIARVEVNHGAKN